MTCMFVVLLASLSLLVALAWEKPEQEVMMRDISDHAQVNMGGETRGSVMLHSHMMHADKKVVKEDDIDKKVLGDGYVLPDGTFVGHIAGAMLIVHADSPATHGHMQEWIIIQDRNCTSLDIADFEAVLAPEVIKIWHGQGGKGLCALLVNSTISSLQQSIETAKGYWSSEITVVETSSSVKLFHPQLSVSETSANASPLFSWWSDLWGKKKKEPWNLDRIDDRFGMDNSYTIPEGGLETTVYALDTGIRDSHIEFEGRASRFADYTNIPYGLCLEGNYMCAHDLNGHGTHCAGTIAGKRFGVANKASIKAIKVFGDNAVGTSGQSTQGMDAVMTDKSTPSVMAMSVGNLGTSKAYETAITWLNHVGIPVVVAAGDQNLDACSGRPAHIPAAITVGSTDKDDQRSSFSNYGECLDIFAPGSQILSAWPTSDTAKKVQSSTSMACSAVAGAAAMLLAKNASLSAWAVRDTLVQLATPARIKNAKRGSPNQLLYVEEDMGQKPLREMSSVCVGNTGPVWVIEWWVKLQGLEKQTQGKRVFVDKGCCMSLADVPSAEDRKVIEIYAEGKLKGQGRLLEAVVYRPESGTGLYECSGSANSWECMHGETNITIEPTADKVCPEWVITKEQNSSWPTSSSRHAH